jgi:hypothetical protein
VKAKRIKATKKLTWTLRRIAGQRVRFVELTKTGDRRDLKTTNNAKGTMKYKPATGATKIIAEVFQNGVLRETRTVVKLK